MLPLSVIDVQSLAGDSTDNVPGVPGLASKQRLSYHTFGDLDGLLAGAETIKQPKRRQNLIEFAEMARISRQLVTLANDVDVPLEVSDLKTPVRDEEKLVNFVTEQGFKSLMTMFGASASPSAAFLLARCNRYKRTGMAGFKPLIVEKSDYELVTI